MRSDSASTTLSALQAAASGRQAPSALPPVDNGGGDGGGGHAQLIPATPPSITIAGLTPVAGVPIGVGGTFSTGHPAGTVEEPPDENTLDGISLGVNPGSAGVGPVSTNGNHWAATVVFTSVGDATLSAGIVAIDPAGRRHTAAGSRQVTVARPDLALSVVSAARTATLDYPLQVEASSPVGVALVAYSADGGTSWTNLAPQGGTRYAATVALPVSNPVDGGAGTSTTLLIGAFDTQSPPLPTGTAGWTSPKPPTQISFQVTAVDTRAPDLDWQLPPADSVVEIAAGSTAAQTTLSVLITDDLNRVASAGPPSQVSYRVDGGAWQPLGQVTQADPALWQVNAQFEGLGDHTVELLCVDHAGNATSLTRVVTVRMAGALTTTEQDYLADLVDYIGNRLTTAAGGPAVTVADLESVLHEPLGQLIGSGGQPRVPASVASAPVNAVRGVIEVLRRYLKAHSGAGAADPLAGSGYPAVAYEALLTALGTSLEELRAARGAASPVREALAARLGLVLSAARPDELDALLLAPTAVTEADLERLFGLQRTDTDPLAPSATAPSLSNWRLQRLRALWALEDHATTGPADYTPPIVDPDLLGPADIANPVPGQPASDLWQQRTAWVQTQTQALQQLRSAQPAASAGLGAMLNQVLPGFDLQATAGSRDAGHDITEALAAQQLDPAGFDRLLTLAVLASDPGTSLTEGEWDDAVAILVQVEKIRRFPAWRQAEQAAGLLLEPTAFVPGAAAPALPKWRAALAARTRWQDRLSARVDQLANLQAGLGAAIAAAERVALPVLRDAALALVAPGGANPLSRRLCIDLQAGPALTTTRLDQAVEAVQGLLASIDAGGGLSAVDLGWVVPVPAGYADLDRVFGELTWMGRYSRWQSAMNVFLYPENHILPSTRSATAITPAFGNLLAAMSGSAGAAVTEEGARELAAQYWNDASWGAAGTPAWWPKAPVPAGYPRSPVAGWPAHGDSTPAGRFPYSERLSESDLASLRDDVERAQLDGLTSLTAVDARLRELFFDLPLQLALALSQSGQWRAALDWLRIVFDRTQPRPAAGARDPRQIFAGFALEPSTDAIARDENWLRGGRLDAHTIAGERAHSYLRFTLLTIAGVLCDWADAEFATDTAETRSLAANLYNEALDVLAAPELEPDAGLPPNPELVALNGRAATGIAKLRSGLNIAGLTRPLTGIGQGGPSVAPSPTNYRYSTLVARAQQLITLASQMEASYLASLEKADNENYQQLLAQQDLDVAGSNVTIASEQAAVAVSDVEVAHLQVKRAQTQSDTYAAWIAAGPNRYERDQLAQIATERDYRAWAAHAQAAGAVLSAAASGAGNALFSAGVATGLSVAAGVANAIGIELSNTAEQAGLIGQADALQASWERRQDEWNLQKQVSDADVAIGRQQITSAQGRAQVSIDQAALAELVHSNAQAKLQFLQSKLTNAALYQWMAGVLGGVYRDLLQRAAAVARLAEQQLAFERQAAVPGYIKTDYWSAPGGSSAPSTATGGLTGSARLLNDITQLDQYAADTNTRKLQLSQTFSLAALAPVDLQRFRETGVLPFALPLSRFGTPGLYLTTIRTVRVSLSALIPPVVGVRGTLAGGGTSHVVVANGNLFDTVTVARPPETVVITSPVSASGVFSVDLTPELELPWEGCGPDLPFELRLPPAINPFDYRTIADVQVSIDYTALYSADYAARVIRELPTRTSNSIALSLRDAPDSWYQLVAQAKASPPPTAPLAARWRLNRGSLPSNLSDLAVEQIALLVVRETDGEVAIDHLRLNGLPNDPATPTAATTVEQIVSTRNGSGIAWNLPVLIGADPVGTWEVGLAADPATVAAVAGGDIEDLVLIVGYGATLPAWPS